MTMHGCAPPPSRVRLYHSAEYFVSSDGTSGPDPPRVEKRGGLKYLVSKFESLASSNKKAVEPAMLRQANGMGTKGRGWRGAVGFKKKEEEIRNGEGEEAMQRIDSLEIARSTRADEIRLTRKEPSDSSIKSQNSLIVRGKKEGRRLLNGLSGKMTRESKTGAESKSKSSRRESLVQLRVRALETVKGSKPTEERPSILREEVPQGPAPVKGSDNSTNLTPTTTHTQGSSGGRSGRQRQKLQKPQPLSSKPSKSSNLLPKADATAKESTTSSEVTSVNGNVKRPQHNVLKKKNPSQVRNRSEVSSDSVHDFEANPRSHPPSEAQVFSLAAREDHGAPRKSVAPTIRERITMFESAKNSQGTSIVALLGAGATAALKRRIADEGMEDGAELVETEVMKRVEYGRSEEKLMSPQQGMVEDTSLTRGGTQRKESKSPISQYLEERKRSSIGTQGSGGDSKVNSKYVPAFATRRSGVASPETTRAVFQAVKGTTPKEGAAGYEMPTSISSPAKLGNFGKATGGSIRTQSPTLSPALQDLIIRRQSERHALSNATSKATSRQPSPHSMDGHNSVSVKRPSQVLIGGLVRPPTGVPSDLIAPPAAPSGTPPGTIDNRVAELIALAAEDDEPIISKGVAEDYHEIERLGSAMGGMKEVAIGFGGNGHGTLQPAAVMARTNQQIRIAKQLAPRQRTPLQRSRSSLSRMLGRDGPAQDREKDDAGATGENKENIPSDEEGKEEKRKEEMRKREERGKREEEERTLVVRSEVVISEPKPLRLVEISRMLRMARFGRSRSGGRLSDIKI